MTTNNHQTPYFDNWLSGFIMGQTIYQTKEGKEMSISINKNNKTLNKVAAQLDTKPIINGQRAILKLKNKKLAAALEEYAPKTFNLSFQVGMIEADLGVVMSSREVDGKYISKQYIKLSSHPIIVKALEKANINFAFRAGKIHVAKLLQIKRFIREFPPRFFFLYRDEILSLRKFIGADPEDRAPIAKLFNESKSL